MTPKKVKCVKLNRPDHTVYYIDPPGKNSESDIYTQHILPLIRVTNDDT